MTAVWIYKERNWKIKFSWIDKHVKWRFSWGSIKLADGKVTAFKPTDEKIRDLVAKILLYTYDISDDYHDIFTDENMADFYNVHVKALYYISKALDRGEEVGLVLIANPDKK